MTASAVLSVVVGSIADVEPLDGLAQVLLLYDFSKALSVTLILEGGINFSTIS